MAVRNFYIKAQVDGRATVVGTGPSGKYDGQAVTILQRDEGEARVIYTVASFALDDGTLRTDIRDSHGLLVHQTETQR